jgi:hypothetical protein
LRLLNLKFFKIILSTCVLLKGVCQNLVVPHKITIGAEWIRVMCVRYRDTTFCCNPGTDQNRIQTYTYVTDILKKNHFLVIFAIWNAWICFTVLISIFVKFKFFQTKICNLQSFEKVSKTSTISTCTHFYSLLISLTRF